MSVEVEIDSRLPLEDNLLLCNSLNLDNDVQFRKLESLESNHGLIGVYDGMYILGDAVIFQDSSTLMYSFQSPFGVIDYDWHEGRCRKLMLQQSDMHYAEHDDAISAWLSSYFKGNTLPLPNLAPAKTSFQSKLRDGLCTIPYGEVRTYGTLAKALNTAPRALGQALGANPLPIIIPCHRVVAANDLGGFHYGSAWKKALLDFEHG